MLESAKQNEIDTQRMLDEAHITEQRASLCDAEAQAARRSTPRPAPAAGRICCSKAGARAVGAAVG
ncbi:MAG TPA: hypothetical protein VD973_28415 [Symbiobacteriaceae bacterium]|nr:hypothetical protein [Symbiobacteriaceae bacterium]